MTDEKIKTLEELPLVSPEVLNSFRWNYQNPDRGINMVDVQEEELKKTNPLLQKFIESHVKVSNDPAYTRLAIYHTLQLLADQMVDTEIRRHGADLEREIDW
jgi:hypothetical protein